MTALMDRYPELVARGAAPNVPDLSAFDAARERLMGFGRLPVLYDLLGRLAWELRAAWANGRRVSLTLERCDVLRVEGIVTRVAPTGAAAVIGGLLVPLDRALAIHWPSRLGDGARSGGRGRGRAVHVHPGQLACDGPEARAAAYPCVWIWKTLRNPGPGPERISHPLAPRAGQRCRRVCQGRNGNVLIEFEDRFRTVAPRHAIRGAA